MTHRFPTWRSGPADLLRTMWMHGTHTDRSIAKSKSMCLGFSAHFFSQSPLIVLTHWNIYELPPDPAVSHARRYGINRWLRLWMGITSSLPDLSAMQDKRADITTAKTPRLASLSVRPKVPKTAILISSTEGEGLCGETNVSRRSMYQCHSPHFHSRGIEFLVRILKIVVLSFKRRLTTFAENFQKKVSFRWRWCCEFRRKQSKHHR